MYRPIDLSKLVCVAAFLTDAAPTFCYRDPLCGLDFPALQIRFLGNAATLFLPTMALSDDLAQIKFDYRFISGFLPCSLKADLIESGAKDGSRKIGDQILTDLLPAFRATPEQDAIPSGTNALLQAICNVTKVAFDVHVGAESVNCLTVDRMQSAGEAFDAAWDVLLASRPSSWKAGRSDDGLIEAYTVICAFRPAAATPKDLALIREFYSRPQPNKARAAEAQAKLDYFGRSSWNAA